MAVCRHCHVNLPLWGEKVEPCLFLGCCINITLPAGNGSNCLKVMALLEKKNKKKQHTCTHAPTGGCMGFAQAASETNMSLSMGSRAAT